MIAELNEPHRRSSRPRLRLRLPWSTRTSSPGSKPAQVDGIGGRYHVRPRWTAATCPEEKPVARRTAPARRSTWAPIVNDRVHRSRPIIMGTRIATTAPGPGPHQQRLHVGPARQLRSALRSARGPRSCAWSRSSRSRPRSPFAWDEDTWYTDEVSGRRRGRQNRRAWQGVGAWHRGARGLDDHGRGPLENHLGAPGIFGNAPIDIYFDNVKVTENQ